MLKKYRVALIIWLMFEMTAVILWISKDNLFYLLNFSYIGTALSIGLVMMINRYKYARHFTQLFSGYACWTAMILDFLPYKQPAHDRKKTGFIRYITFALSFAFVVFLFAGKAGNLERIMFRSFVISNIIYYAVGIILAFVLKDNRAFCKYVCPVTVFLKPMSYFSLIRIKCDKKKCISCGQCKKVCPMDVDVTDNSRNRINGTECIMCMECVRVCPEKAL